MRKSRAKTAAAKVQLQSSLEKVRRANAFGHHLVQQLMPSLSARLRRFSRAPYPPDVDVRDIKPRTRMKRAATEEIRIERERKGNREAQARYYRRKMWITQEDIRELEFARKQNRIFKQLTEEIKIMFSRAKIKPLSRLEVLAFASCFRQILEPELGN